MSLAVLLGLGLLIGAGLALQPGVNAQLQRALGDPMRVAFISFAMGTLLLAVPSFLSRVPFSASRAASAPWWSWTGGVMGAFIVAGSLILAPRLGAFALVAVVLAGQVLTSILLDHFGAAGYPVHALTSGRIVGGLLLVAGVVIILKS